jgi:hypothetical protein
MGLDGHKNLCVFVALAFGMPIRNNIKLWWFFRFPQVTPGGALRAGGGGIFFSRWIVLYER